MTNRTRAFTLIETMVAVSLLAFSIVAPMTLTSQSLGAAYYARDQITAYNLAQEGLEAVRAIRDGQILQISLTISSGQTLFGPIPIDQDFRIDSRDSNPSTAISLCSSDPGGTCESLETDGTVYGYGLSTPTYFKRTLRACYVQTNGACNSTVSDEMRVSSTVSWTTGSLKTRTFTISDNFYRWVADGSAQ